MSCAQIMQAMDGQEALALVEDEEDLPDVILLDVMMPGMSGYEVGCRLIEEGWVQCMMQPLEHMAAQVPQLCNVRTAHRFAVLHVHGCFVPCMV